MQFCKCPSLVLLQFNLKDVNTVKCNFDHNYQPPGLVCVAQAACQR